MKYLIRRGVSRSCAELKQLNEYDRIRGYKNEQNEQKYRIFFKIFYKNFCKQFCLYFNIIVWIYNINHNLSQIKSIEFYKHVYDISLNIEVGVGG